MLFTHCLVWPIIETLVNGACSPIMCVDYHHHLTSWVHQAYSAIIVVIGYSPEHCVRGLDSLS